MRNRKVTGGLLGNGAPRRPLSPADAPLELAGPPWLSVAQRQQWANDWRAWARTSGLPPGLPIGELEALSMDKLNEQSARALGFPPGLSAREVQALLEQDTRTGIKVRMSGQKGGAPRAAERPPWSWLNSRSVGQRHRGTYPTAHWRRELVKSSDSKREPRLKR